MAQGVLGDRGLLTNDPGALRASLQAQRAVERLARKSDELRVGLGDQLRTIDSAEEYAHEHESLGGAPGEEVRLEEGAQRGQFLARGGQESIPVRPRAEGLEAERERHDRDPGARSLAERFRGLEVEVAQEGRGVE